MVEVRYKATRAVVTVSDSAGATLVKLGLAEVVEKDAPLPEAATPKTKPKVKPKKGT